jgi:hypothetical protein
MKKPHCLSLLFFLLVTQTSRGQLSGNYTIGDSTCTFVNIQNAIDSLLQAGTAGNVKFLIKPGNYDSFSLSGYQPSHASDTVTFQSQSGRASDVIIRGEIRVINSAQVFSDIYSSNLTTTSKLPVSVYLIPIKSLLPPVLL